MAKYGERISGRPSYQSHRQTYSSPQEATTTGPRLSTAADSRCDPVIPRSLQEEVLWRQRRFAWWGTTYLPDPILPSAHHHPSHIRSRLLQKILNRDVCQLALAFKAIFEQDGFSLLLSLHIHRCQL